jgi:hypothetical protein
MITRRTIAIIGLFLIAITILMTMPQPVQAQTNKRCFDETPFCISGPLREYWETNGGLAVFGLPKSDQYEEIIEGKPYQVQWFERNRLEIHPENKPPYHVLLGRLGAGPVEAAKQAATWQPPDAETAQPGCLYYPETGWNVCGAILQAYRANGLETDGQAGFSSNDNKALFGLPLTPLVTMQIENKPYQVQWFERARFELHPENTSPHTVLLGLLGNETLLNASSSTPTLTLATNAPSVPSTSERKITMKVMDEVRTEPTRNLKITFPFLEETDAQAQAFNQAVAAFVKESIDGFEKDLADWQVAPEAPGEDGIWIDSEVTLNTNDLVSILFTVSVFFRGAAHPNHESFVLNYQLDQARILQLADMFQPQSDYLERIAAYCIQELPQHSDMLFENFAQEGAAPSAENYRFWNLTLQGVQISFDQYQVAPYVAGRQQITIPYAELRSIINPQGPLAALLIPNTDE